MGDIFPEKSGNLISNIVFEKPFPILSLFYFFKLPRFKIHATFSKWVLLVNDKYKSEKFEHKNKHLKNTI